MMRNSSNATSTLNAMIQRAHALSRSAQGPSRSHATSTMGLLHSHGEPSSERKTHSHSPTSHSQSKNHKSFLGQNSHGYTFALPRTEQQNEERKGFSTAVSGSYNHGHGFAHESHNIFAHAKNTISASSSTYKFEENEMTRLENSPDAANVVHGQEVLLSEAASLVKKSNDNNANENHTQQAVDVKHFDKILILLEHGEAHAVTKAEEKLSFGTKIQGQYCLTSEGIGQVLKTSGTTAKFCNSQTGLIPQLFITSPHKITVESALLSFPYYTPDSIYGSKWMYRDDCHDFEVEDSLETLKTFTGIERKEDSTVDRSIDTSIDGTERVDFLTWLETRPEKIIAISSTPSWIESFCNGTGSGGTHTVSSDMNHDEKGESPKGCDVHPSGHLRAVGIKFF
jgi:hypothetical protein